MRRPACPPALQTAAGRGTAWYNARRPAPGAVAATTVVVVVVVVCDENFCGDWESGRYVLAVNSRPGRDGSAAGREDETQTQGG
jgi:hypothetical protein